MGAVRLRIDLAYDGAPFAGFARQRDQRTVQGDLEEVLQRLVGHPVVTTCAGRTDRGVHALAQVVHVDLDPVGRRARAAVGDVDALAVSLDAQLGESIGIWRVRVVSRRFDARFSATRRGYRYRLVDERSAADPVSRHDRWRIDDPLDVVAMRAAARCLIGEHDFASFCRRGKGEKGEKGRSSRRRIDELAITRPRPGRVDVRLAGPAFCHQQVRSIVGCLVEIGRGRRCVDWLADVLEARNRAAAARVAPAHGLTLERVSYGRAWPAAPPGDVRAALGARLA